MKVGFVSIFVYSQVDVPSIDWEATDDFHPEETDEVRDYEKNQFLDLRRPLLRQVWEANFRCIFISVRWYASELIDI